MRAVKEKVRDLIDILDREQKEAKSLIDTMHRLHDYLEEEPKTIIQESLGRLLSRIRAEAAKITRGLVLVLVSPEAVVTVDKTYSDEDSDPYMRRLKSQGFYILTLPGFSYFIKSLKSEVAQGNWLPAIEFLRANTKFDSTPVYLPSPAEQPRESSTSSEWKLPDWLPAPPPYPPLPRRLFKD